MAPHDSPMRSMLLMIRSWFLNGLLTLLPVILTLGIFSWSFNLLKRWLEPVTTIVPTALHSVLPHSEFLITLIFIFVVGAFVTHFLLKRLITSIEHVLEKVPLLSQVYFGIKQLIAFLTAQEKFAVNQVVLIEFPHPGMYAIGFMTSEIAAAHAPNPTEKFCSVFVPTTPNPTTGFYLMVPARDCKPLDLTRNEAMAIIISGGIIQPERYTKSSP